MYLAGLHVRCNYESVCESVYRNNIDSTNYLAVIFRYFMLKLGMLNSVFSCNRSSIVQNRILTEARSLPVDAYHAMSTESAT